VQLQAAVAFGLQHPDGARLAQNGGGGVTEPSQLLVNQAFSRKLLGALVDPVEYFVAHRHSPVAVTTLTSNLAPNSNAWATTDPLSGIRGGSVADVPATVGS